MKNIENWIWKTLVSKNDFLDTSSYQNSCEVYSTQLSHNFVATIINGKGNASNYFTQSNELQYDFIIRQISEITNKEPAFWFYYTVIDDVVGNLNSIWKNDYSRIADYPLEKFELEPAEQGATSYLGLLAENKNWLLLHEYNQAYSLDINFFSTTKNLVNQLIYRLIKID